MTDHAALPVGRTRVPVVQDVEPPPRRHADTGSGLAPRPGVVRRQAVCRLAAKIDARTAAIIESTGIAVEVLAAGSRSQTGSEQEVIGRQCRQVIAADRTTQVDAELYARKMGE